MKKMILSLSLLMTILVSAQPKLVGTLSFNGPAEGGSIFRLDRPGTSPGTIYSFNNLSPHRPGGSMCAGDADWLYGTLKYNGIDLNDALYRIKKDGTGFAMLYNITNSPGTDLIPFYHTDGMIYFSNEFEFKKFDPSTSAVTTIPLNTSVYIKNLWIDSNDWMYFMTSLGTLAKMKTDGTLWTDLHSFTPATEGSNGIAGVTEVPGNKLFGVQMYDGIFNGGTLYSINKDGTGFTVHHQFSNATGFQPESRLVYFDGKLFGTTYQGGNFGYGVLYVIDADGTNYRVLHHFASGTPGDSPAGNIAISSNGRIFGSFSQFANNGTGYNRLFKVDTSGANFSTFLSVDQRQHGQGNLGVLLLNDENIFLTTSEMGRHDGGVLSAADTSGFANALYHFGYSPNGFRPTAALIKATNNKLYGTATIGGTDGNGVIYSINIDGSAYTKLHEFTDAEGYEPTGKLLEASDGKLYGACKWGGPTGGGCIYRIDKTGANFQVIYNFPDITEGYAPVGGLVEDNTGKLYGANYYSAPGYGSIFKINKDGTNYSILKNFVNGTDPAYPYGGLTLSGNYLYGSAGYGSTGNGALFRIRTDGTGYEELHAFDGTNGATPTSAPVIASNGKIYGTTYMGGANSNGVIYRMDITGANFTVLKTFSSATDGAYPWSGVIQASDGLIYGTIISDAVGRSAVYKINLDGTGYLQLKEFDFVADGFSASTLLDLSGGFALPVKLLSFDAIKKDQLVLLNWQTSEEQNSKQFEIERSADGNHFAAIGIVAAKGNSGSVSAYSFTDANPLDGKNYYRLKLVDRDASFDYSAIRSVAFEVKKIFSVYPNPVADVLHIKFSKAVAAAEIQVINADGKILRTAVIDHSLQYDMPVSAFSAGIYTVKINIAGKIESAPFIKK